MRWSGCAPSLNPQKLWRVLRDAAMISLMSDCLLRISEAVAVDVEDIGEEGLQIHRERSERYFVYLRMDAGPDRYAIVGSLGLNRARCLGEYASRIM